MLTMRTESWQLLISIIFYWFGVKAEGIDNVLLQRLEATEELVKTLSHRVDHLESRDKLHLHKINELETRDQRQQATIDKLENVVQEQRQLIEAMEETQHAIIIEVERQRQLLESLDENLDYLVSSINTTSDDPTRSNKHTSFKRSHSISTDKEIPSIRIRQTESEVPIAFYARIGHDHLIHVGVNQIIIFDSIVTNVGNGYDGLLGTFTAPVNGIFVFSTTLTADANLNAHASLYKNDERINYMFVNGMESGYDSTSTTVVLQLSKGDVVGVHNDFPDTNIYGSAYSSFSGFLLSSFNNNQNFAIGK